MNAIAIIQARMGSTRLPGKVLLEILGTPMLGHIVERVSLAPGVAGVVVATSDQPADAPIRAFCRERSIVFFAGSEQDVLDRFYRAAADNSADPVIRITGDCPFADPGVIGRLLALYGSGGYDHVGVATGAGAIFLEGGRFPDGLDAECFSFAALKRAWREATLPADREHVTPYIWRNKDLFRCGNLLADGDFSSMRWTVDNSADFEFATGVYAGLYRPGKPFCMTEVLDYVLAHPELAELNRSFIGQEGYRKLWQLGDGES